MCDICRLVHLMEPLNLCLLEKDMSLSMRRGSGVWMQTQRISRMHTIYESTSQWGCWCDIHRLQLGLGAYRGCATHSTRQTIPAPEILQSNNSGSTQNWKTKIIKPERCVPMLIVGSNIPFCSCHNNIKTLYVSYDPRTFSPIFAVAGVAFEEMAKGWENLSNESSVFYWC